MLKCNKRIRNRMLILLMMILFSFPSIAFAGTYWVSPTGTATWANAQSATPLSGAACCSLSTANANADAGDTVVLRSGTYALGIYPVNTGIGAGSGRIIYQAHTGETPILEGAGAGGQNGSGIYIGGKDWIKVDGVTVRDCTYFMVAVVGGADYNEITNCEIYNTDHNVPRGYSMWSYIGGISNPSTHTWFHNNIVHDTSVKDGCSDGTGVIQFGSWNANDQGSNYNTIEDNTFYHGGHHTLQSYTHYNIIRNNLFHNEGFRPYPDGGCDDGSHYDTDSVNNPPGFRKYAHRNVEFQNPTEDDDTWVLFENNRLGYASANPANNGSEQLTLTSDANIIRYNAMYGGDGPGIYFKSVQATYPRRNRLYNNTIFDNGRYDGSYWPGMPVGTPMQTRAVYVYASASIQDNILKNNLFWANDMNSDNYYYSTTNDFSCTDCSTYGVIPSNNWCKSPTEGYCSASGDPLFVSTPATTAELIESRSKTSPDLNLQSSSGAIDAGTYLTQANGSGSSSTTLIVDDARYFQDGSWGSSLSNVDADWIAVGTVGNIVQISSINYATNTITLTSGISYNDGDSIWLVKDSRGNVVLRGSAPDMGAYESRISPPKNLRIVP